MASQGVLDDKLMQAVKEIGSFGRPGANERLVTAGMGSTQICYPDAGTILNQNVSTLAQFLQKCNFVRQGERTKFDKFVDPKVQGA